MEFELHSHRYATSILEKEEEFQETWGEIKQAITNVTDEMLIELFNKKYALTNKSLSKVINELLKDQLVDYGWKKESPIFQDNQYNDNTWRLDFAKDNISVEVAFNHSGSVAWNLLKPVIASELNHVNKAIQTKVGVIICATEEMKLAGGFDSAIGTLETYKSYLLPLQSQLSVPIALVGLKKPSSFHLEHYKLEENKTLGRIILA